MAVPVHVQIVDRSSGLVVNTHAAYPNEDGSLCLTGSVDLPAGDYDFAVRISADSGGPVTWTGGALQMVVGQTVTEVHCNSESGSL